MDIDSLPRVTLGSWPTPVRLLERTSDELGAEIWVKDEAACGAWGGNKVRKLEHIFHELRSASVESLVAWGAATSNWAAACAWHGASNGFRVRVGLGGRVPQNYRRLYERTGAHITVLPRIELAPIAATIARGGAGPRARLLPVGGSGGAGDLGATRAGAEIAKAVRDGAIPEPERVFVATGSCGTVAGIALGLASEGLSLPVTAVKVADWPYASRSMLARRVRSLRRNLQALGLAAPAAAIDLETRFLGRGYGRPTPESRAAITLARHDGVELEGTYAAKAFAALMDGARDGSGPYLFVNTSPGPPPT